MSLRRLKKAGRASRSLNRPRAAGGSNPDVRVWQEDENPYARVAQGLSDRGIASGTIGVEETVKFVFSDNHPKSRCQRHIHDRNSGHRRMPHDQERDMKSN